MPHLDDEQVSWYVTARATGMEPVASIEQHLAHCWLCRLMIQIEQDAVEVEMERVMAE